MKTSAQKITYRNDPRVYTIGLFLVVCTFVGLYMYFLVMSVMHVVIQREVVRDMAVVRADITELESQYIQAQHSVSEELALQHGFVEQQEKVFIVVSNESRVVTLDDR